MAKKKVNKAARKLPVKKKSAASAAKKAGKKKPAAKTSAAKTPTRKIAKSSAKTASTPKRVKKAKKAAKADKNRTGATRKAASLGRPRIPGDARLDLVFQKDYQAREIFAFLQIHTIKELEEFSPQDIIERLAGPLVQTVTRIRKTLALYHRALADDTHFALEFREQLARQ